MARKGNIKVTLSKLGANISGNDTGAGLFRNTAMNAESLTLSSWATAQRTEHWSSAKASWALR